MRVISAAPTAILVTNPAGDGDMQNVELTVEAWGETLLTAPVPYSREQIPWLLFGALPDALFVAAERILVEHGWQLRPDSRRWSGGGDYPMQIRVQRA